jgi:hypothetical protein
MTPDTSQGAQSRSAWPPGDPVPFLGHVDISIEMRQPGGDPLTRRRQLHALSLFAETPRRLVVELNGRCDRLRPGRGNGPR